MELSGLRIGLLRLAPLAAGLCLAASALTLSSTEAQAHRHHYRHYWRPAHLHARARTPGSSQASSTPSEVDGSKFSAIVVDANTGREIWGVNENALRHPASITKVMTLYLLFEQLEKGTMTLETRIPVSEHAATQEPSKLGVPAGQTISVEDAIKAIVTRSANDMAVAVAEAVGHDEPTFAAMMTRKAHQLGMSRTLYRDASGLPNDEQLTTARDLSVLARAMQERFPKYFHYFSLHEFTYDGEVIGNHDHLLGRVEGVDGIKTGYTRASGFNLLTSVHRDGRALVAVVMGGRSAAARDRLMERLIDDHLAEASTDRTATRVADSTPDSLAQPSGREASRAAPVVEREAVADVEPARAGPDSQPQSEGDDSDGDAPPAPVAHLTPAPVAHLTPAPVAHMTPAPVAHLAPAPKPASRAAVAPAAVKIAKAEPTPRELGWAKGKDAANAPARREPSRKAERDETRIARGSIKNEDSDEEASSKPARGAWVIQIGVSEDPGKARDLLNRAKSRNPRLAAVRGFTEKVRKRGDTLYRVRFAGLEQASAEQACRTLRHGGLPCFAAHDN